jgi:acetyltransferase
MIRLPSKGRFSADRMFRPTSVAMIGAGTVAGDHVLANIAASAFRGDVFPVGTTAEGPSTFPAISDLPAAPDLALIASANGPISATFAALAAKGSFAAIVLCPADGIQEAVRETGVRALGPRSFGLAVPGIHLNASLAHLTPKPGRLALVSQSTALCRSVIDWAEPNGVGFSHVVGIGDNADIGFGLVLDWLARDSGTGAILLDLQRIKNGRAFLSAARAAARLRPVVAMRAGGLLLDPTGAANAALEAALRRAGVLMVSGLEDLLAAAETLTRAKPVRREGLAIVTNAVGPGRIAADRVLMEGLALADLSPTSWQILRATLVDPINAVAPGVLYVGAENALRLAETTALLAGSHDVGGILVVHAPTGGCEEAGITALSAMASSLHVPLLACITGETTGAGHRRQLAEAGLPVFAVPEPAVRGFRHIMQDRRNRLAARELPASAVLEVAPDQLTVQRRFSQIRTSGRLALCPDEALEILSAYGVPIVPHRAVETAEDAANAAAALGFPVVIKARTTEPPSQRGTGSLMLDLRDAAAVRFAVAAIGRSAPVHDGFLVERQVGRARELALRVFDDALFGPIISFGQGGTAPASLFDVALDLPPLNLTLAKALIARTRVAAALGPLRDQPAADIESVAKTLVRVSQLIVDFPEIAELEVNPLFADSHGVIVADAWMALRAEHDPPARLAIAPYPAELQETIELAGERLAIRPIRPEDAEAHRAFFARLAPEDVRFRFFTAMRELSPEQTARMTQVDYDREMAFIASREATGDTVGVARLVVESDTRSGEFAIIVQPDMKGKGLASHLMQRLIDWARTRKLAEIVGQVLADNAPMLAFVRHLGFEVHHMPGEEDVVETRLALES